MKQPEKVSSRTVFEGKFFTVVSDTFIREDGSSTTWDVVRHPGAVGVVATAEDGSVLLVRQARHTVEDNLLELPAGKLEQGEDPLECARRELEEETGYRGSLELIKTFYTTPGFSDERFYLYLASDLEKVGDASGMDGDEPISIEWLGAPELRASLFDGRIEDAKTLIGLSLLLLMDEAPI